MRAVVTALVLLHGIVMRGPTTPVCYVGKPCTEPARGAVLVFSRNSQVVARARVDDLGRYSLRLRPGTYTVRLAVQTTIGAGLAPRAVTLLHTASLRRDFSIDTGIR